MPGGHPVDREVDSGTLQRPLVQASPSGTYSPCGLVLTCRACPGTLVLARSVDLFRSGLPRRLLGTGCMWPERPCSAGRPGPYRPSLANHNHLRAWDHIDAGQTTKEIFLTPHQKHPKTAVCQRTL